LSALFVHWTKGLPSPVGNDMWGFVELYRTATPFRLPALGQCMIRTFSCRYWKMHVPRSRSDTTSGSPFLPPIGVASEWSACSRPTERQVVRHSVARRTDMPGLGLASRWIWRWFCQRSRSCKLIIGLDRSCGDPIRQFRNCRRDGLVRLAGVKLVLFDRRRAAVSARCLPFWRRIKRQVSVSIYNRERST
jgi:hypothetical protein